MPGNQPSNQNAKFLDCLLYLTSGFGPRYAPVRCVRQLFKNSLKVVTNEKGGAVGEVVVTIIC